MIFPDIFSFLIVFRMLLIDFTDDCQDIFHPDIFRRVLNVFPDSYQDFMCLDCYQEHPDYKS